MRTWCVRNTIMIGDHDRTMPLSDTVAIAAADRAGDRSKAGPAQYWSRGCDICVAPFRPSMRRVFEIPWQMPWIEFALVQSETPPLPCVSTAFVAKTVPFLAVLQVGHANHSQVLADRVDVSRHGAQ